MAKFLNILGQNSHIMDTYSQKQPLMPHSLYSMPMDIQPGKMFANPNFVNKNNPRIHSQYSFQSFGPMESRRDINLSDIQLKNSSYNSILDTVKEKNFKVIEGDRPSLESEDSQTRKGTKRKVKHGESNCIRKDDQPFLHTDMDIDTVASTELHCSEICMSPMSPAPVHAEEAFEDDDYVTVEEDQFQIVDLSPSNGGTARIRERQLSIAESEDSFIVFRSGTDDELMFSDTDDDTDSELDQDFDSVDSSSSVIPYKKVRFAEESELCEVHPMVQWSFAYQQARKGPWEEYARDRDRFNKRIRDAEQVLAPIMAQKHRDRIYEQRFQDDYCLSQEAVIFKM